MTNGVSPESVGFSSQRLSRVNKMMQGHIDDGKLASGLTMLARGGETFHFEPYGVLNLESGTPVERDTLFRIYSMTKPLTSAAVMMLYEEGHFSLDDPVGKFIPELASMKVYDGMGETGMRLVDQRQAITIRHLLTHTSGLSYGFHQDSPIEQDVPRGEHHRPGQHPSRDGGKARQAAARHPARRQVAVQQRHRCSRIPCRGRLRHAIRPVPAGQHTRPAGHGGTPPSMWVRRIWTGLQPCTGRPQMAK